ncbi:hypothetical protein [Roseibium aggregatum]|uniref:hypothetical protein n=1 Tax=Roseibium aggregatum TaxID=187304 RepID=UPI001E4D54FC|nr:hypothetical protein [Roseibium aggregatum]UES49923.1 hypothetical protein GFK88_10030 [Roseibium aggregatum]
MNGETETAIQRILELHERLAENLVFNDQFEKLIETLKHHLENPNYSSPPPSFGSNTKQGFEQSFDVLFSVEIEAFLPEHDQVTSCQDANNIQLLHISLYEFRKLLLEDAA